MDARKKGAWLLAQSKTLDHVAGPGLARLEKIAYSGKIGRLYNILRRSSNASETSRIEAAVVERLCQLNNIDVASRKDGLNVLRAQSRIDLFADGTVDILGASTSAVLEFTSTVFNDANPSKDEEAALLVSETVASRPIDRKAALEIIGDTFSMTEAKAGSLIDLCKTTALIDEESARGQIILFNSNTFRDKDRAKKAYHVLQNLSPTEAGLLSEVEELLRKKGALGSDEVERVIGPSLLNRLVSVGYFDRMEVNNPQESAGYLALPDAFQRYGKPFEEDPVDDAKALLASLSYGMTRSTAGRGRIVMPIALLTKLVSGEKVGGPYGATAIGEDYRELERRGVVSLSPAGGTRFRMRLLKPDVGQLALAIIRGGQGSEEALTLGTEPATGFKGPDELRRNVRRKNTAEDRVFVMNALNRIRSGG